jgi:hypothetical protein
VPGKLAQHRRRLTLKHEDVATNDGVEWPLERHLGSIALAEGHVPQPSGLCSRPRCRDSGWHALGPDHFARGADHLCCQESHIAGTAADIQHTHTGHDSRSAEDLPRDGVDKARLRAQTIEFSLRMAEYIGVGRTVVVRVIHVLAPVVLSFSTAASWTSRCSYWPLYSAQRFVKRCALSPAPA